MYNQPQLMRFVPLDCLYFKSKRSLKVDRAITQEFTHFTVMDQYLRNLAIIKRKTF